PGRAVGEEQVVGERYERCALATEGDVGAAEIVDDRDAQLDRHTRRVADLQGRVLRGEVGDGLTVDRDAVRRATRRRHDLTRELRVRVPELRVQHRDVVRRQRRA